MGRPPKELDSDTFGYRLRKAREACGPDYTPKHCASEIGMPEKSWHDLENGRAKIPRGDVLLLIAELLDTDPYMLARGKPLRSPGKRKVA